jgi:hypothetical protein
MTTFRFDVKLEKRVVGVAGLEPATSGFVDQRSIQLSYTPLVPGERN